MEKAEVSPSVTVSHDLWNKRLQIDVKPPDVDQKNISLDLKDDCFCITAPRNGTVYSGCFLLDHEVETEKAETKYELLRPLKARQPGIASGRDSWAVLL